MKKKVVAIIVGVVAVAAVVAVLLIGFMPNKATKAVIEQINSIGTVSLSSESAINKALNDYNALTDKEKSQVSNYDILLDSQSTLKKLQDEENYQKVIELIEDLKGSCSHSIEEIKAKENSINDLFDSLSDEYKLKVTNYTELNVNLITYVLKSLDVICYDYEFDEATKILNEYDDIMTEEQHIEALAILGKYKCSQNGVVYSKEKMRRVYSSIMSKERETVIYQRVGVDKPQVSNCKVDVSLDFYTYTYTGGPYTHWEYLTYTFDMNLSDNTISNVTLIE